MNRETFPGGIYPLQGDVQSQAGASKVAVVGLQNTPVVSAPPIDQDKLVYQLTAGAWVPTPDPNTSILVNGVSVSDDYLVTVNSPKQILVNGA